MTKDQDDVRTRTLDVEADGCEIPVRVVWKGPSQGRAVFILHEKRGLDDHTIALAERLAGEGFTALLPDLLSRQGGSDPASRRTGPGARGTPRSWVLEDVAASIDAMLEVFHVDRFGVVGYSFGGELAWQVAATDDRCSVLIDFHGRPRHSDALDLRGVAALAVFSELDDADKLGDTRAALRTARIAHVEVFEGQRRGFEDPSRAERFDAEAAELAWRLTVSWLRGHLS